MEESIMVPESRIGVIIGSNGETRKEIASKTGTRIEVDSEIGEVLVRGQQKNAIGFLNALNIIKAIARGFSPENAFLLLNKNFALEIIRLSEYVGKNESTIKAKRGRIIGRDGKAREKIEKKTMTKISVQGKTIAIIGDAKNIEKSKTAVEMLLGGAKHATAFDELEIREKTEKFKI